MVRTGQMDENLVKKLVEIAEEYINELDDETVNSSNDKRKKAVKDAMAKYLEAQNNNDAEGMHNAEQEEWAASKKLERNNELKEKRERRIAKKVADFREKLINTPANAKASKQAGIEHADAMINQYLRNKLEKSLKESFVSEACIKDILSLVEGELINFQEKRKQKVLDRNAIKMAKMMQDGSLNAVRVLPNNELIGDPTAIKMVKDIQKENADVINAARKKAKTENG